MIPGLPLDSRDIGKTERETLPLRSKRMDRENPHLQRLAVLGWQSAEPFFFFLRSFLLSIFFCRSAAVNVQRGACVLAERSIGGRDERWNEKGEERGIEKARNEGSSNVCVRRREFLG